jgi:hypothetical protein
MDDLGTISRLATAARVATARQAMTTSIDHRKAAEERLQALVTLVEAGPRTDSVASFLDECASLAVAIRAFHMEAIRFRMFNVDRMLNKGAVSVDEAGRAAFADVRRHLEAAGFHTRSHQAPT